MRDQKRASRSSGDSDPLTTSTSKDWSPSTATNTPSKSPDVTGWRGGRRRGSAYVPRRGPLHSGVRVCGTCYRLGRSHCSATSLAEDGESRGDGYLTTIRIREGVEQLLIRVVFVCRHGSLSVGIRRTSPRVVVQGSCLPPRRTVASEGRWRRVPQRTGSSVSGRRSGTGRSASERIRSGMKVSDTDFQNLETGASHYVRTGRTLNQVCAPRLPDAASLVPQRY